MQYMNGEELEDTLKYQDFITIQLHKRGWVVNQLASKFYNVTYGESISGIEIKQDKKLKETNNLYIETAEKHNAKEFVPSGVNRNDNTILWCIGNYDVAYILSKKQLKYICDNVDKYKIYGLRRVETETSKGVLIPTKFLEDNDIYVIKKLIFNMGDKWKDLNEKI